jgi:hypothetical protein
MPHGESLLPNFWKCYKQVWQTPSLRQPVLLIATLVGFTVSLSHHFLDGVLEELTWLFIHMAMPTMVFFGSAMASKHGRIDRQLIIQGILTVVAVTSLFSVINQWLHLPEPLRWLLNFLTPILVSSIGAASGIAAATPGKKI